MCVILLPITILLDKRLWAPGQLWRVIIICKWLILFTIVPRPNDDAVPSAIANYLGVNLYQMNITHTGGNIMTDGQGKVNEYHPILTENSSLSQSAITDMFNTYMGITDYQLYPDPLIIHI